jgi:hypothetical protein
MNRSSSIALPALIHFADYHEGHELPKVLITDPAIKVQELGTAKIKGYQYSRYVFLVYKSSLFTSGEINELLKKHKIKLEK